MKKLLFLASIAIGIGVWWAVGTRHPDPRFVLEKYLPTARHQTVEIVSMETLKGGWDVEYHFHLKHPSEVFASIFSGFQKEDDAGANWVKAEFNGKIESFEKGQPMNVYRHDIGNTNFCVAVNKERTESWLQIGID